ncbi:MAG: NHLP bacteriocin system secretion protein [Candidatus Muirbacterium halophilum]|nr:NHLP bacteriocin system secretion protein [Candidatus Muirbacterium halophilum]MCK9476499.1 NHLP bacteriocin system secretion protein [Candidatus Muirbacterium halophilum]
MNNNLFRKKALDKLQSPEQLDQLMTVTSPAGWIALLAIGVFVIIITIWSFYGELPQRVTGKGMLIKSGGLYSITHVASGKVTDVRVKENDIIKKGDVIGRVEQLSLLENLKSARENLLIYEKNLQDLSSLKVESEKVKKSIIAKNIQNLSENIQASMRNLEFLKEKEKNHAELLKDGIITKQMLVNTQIEIKSTEHNIENLKNKIKEANLQSISSEQEKKQEINRVNEQIKQMKKQIHELEQTFYENSRIVSSYHGRVVEVDIAENDLIRPGMTVLKLELMGKDIKDLEAVIYIPVTEGKKVHVGMDVQISPSTVKKEEYGYILGRVSKVSDYPVTAFGMNKVLGNDILAEAIAKTGAPIEVYADLDINTQTISGFKWSSIDGPPNKVFSGTICDVTITVKKQRPITLVIPAFRKILGM